MQYKRHFYPLHWLWFGLCLAWTAPLWAEPNGADARLKAAFVFNFLKFTDWPNEAATAPLTLCVSNADSKLEAAFNALNGLNVNGHALRVVFILAVANPQNCHVLYVKQGGVPIALKPLANTLPSLLTVGDAEDFIEEGGVIGMVEREGRLQFDINLELVRRSNYRISSQLLKLARSTRSE